jgi:hypothetical protein
LYTRANRCEYVQFSSRVFPPFILVSFPCCTHIAHDFRKECTRMPVIVKLPSGNWRAQVRRKGKYISNTFRRRADAHTWALETKRTIDRGLTQRPWCPVRFIFFNTLIHCNALRIVKTEVSGVCNACVRHVVDRVIADKTQEFDSD